jgi:uncharacterized protein (TIGR02466 family)
MKNHVVFPVSILSHKVDHQLADKIENLFLERIHRLEKNKQQYTDFFNKGGKERVFDLEKDIPEFYDILNKCKDEYVHTTGIRISDNAFDSWTQDYRDEGQYHVRHNHGPYGISGIYWIRANEHASDIKFYNPNVANLYVAYSRDRDYSTRNIGFKAKKGMILLFPSYLEHEVFPSNDKTIRSTISFNFNLLHKNT